MNFRSIAITALSIASVSFYFIPISLSQAPQSRLNDELNDLIGSTWIGKNKQKLIITKSQSSNEYYLRFVVRSGVESGSKCYFNYCGERLLENLKLDSQNKLNGYTTYPSRYPSYKIKLSIIKSGKKIITEAIIPRKDIFNRMMDVNVRDSFIKEEVVAETPTPERSSIPTPEIKSTPEIKPTPEIKAKPQYSRYQSSRSSKMDDKLCIKEAKSTMQKMKLKNIEDGIDFVRGEKNASDSVSIRCRISPSIRGYCGSKGTQIQFIVKSNRNNGSRLYDELMSTFKEPSVGCL